jgi:hypothetical protein
MARSRESREGSKSDFYSLSEIFDGYRDPFVENMWREKEDEERRYQRELREATTSAQKLYYTRRAENARYEREYLKLLIQRERQEAEIRYRNSPEGKAKIQKDMARRYYFKVRIIDFFFKRPINLINKFVKKVNNDVNYKNYISLIVWLLWIFTTIIYGLTNSIPLIGLTVGIIFVFYYLKFEVIYSPQ